MTPQQIALVQKSLPEIVAIRSEAAALFYERLFDIDPTTRRLFGATDLRSQGTKLMAAIAVVVNGLSRPETILADVRMLGRRHLDYGVESRHYDSVGQALLWTLEQGLGEAFTPELRDAWTAAYVLLAGAMQEAAHPMAA